MNYFATPTPAPKPKTEATTQISLFYAALLVVFAVTQLFTFEDFIELTIAYDLPLNALLIGAMAPVLVASEVFALPFLLRMSLSPAFRVVSMACGWLVPAIWLGISGWLAATGSTVSTIGFTGALFDLVPGWWAVGVSLLLGVMAAWSSWGIWPLPKSKK